MSKALSLVLVIACIANLGAGLRKRRASENQSSALALQSSDCEELVDLKLGDVEVGHAAKLVCRFWPARFGEFPIHGVSRATELLNHGFAEGGLYDQLKELAEERGRNSDFCWRAEKDFVPFDCFKFDNFYEPDMKGQKRSKEPTDMWCQKRCALTTGCKHFSYWSMDRGCHLQGANAYDAGKGYFRNPTSGPPSCENTPPTDQRPVMKCPAGFQPSGLLNVFESVCSQTCEGTEFPVGCGFGCANDTRACRSTIKDQVSTVVTTVGQVAAFLTGNQALAKVVEKILGLVDFLITTFWKVVRKGKELWAAFQEAESLSALLTVFVAFIVNNAEEFNQSIDTLNEKFGDVVSFWVDMMEGGFKWVDINLGFIVDTIDKYGEDILDGAFGLVSAFTYPVCDQ